MTPVPTVEVPHKSEATTRQSEATKGVLAILVAVLALSMGSTLVKSTGSPGPVVAFWRLLLGAILWHGYVAVRGSQVGGGRFANRDAWKAAALPGIAFGVNISLFYSGVIRTPVAHAEFIGALTPLVIVPYASWRLKERIPRQVIVAGGFAVAGIALILSARATTRKATDSWVGDVLVFTAIFCWAYYLIRSKKARERVSTGPFMAVVTSAAAVTTLPLALLTAGGPAQLVRLTPKAWALIAVMAVTAGMLAHGLITWAQRRIPVGTISLLQLGQPGLSVLWAATFLSESVRAIQIVGMAVVLAAVGAIAYSSSRAPDSRAVLEASPVG